MEYSLGYLYRVLESVISWESIYILGAYLHSYQNEQTKKCFFFLLHWSAVFLLYAR